MTAPRWLPRAAAVLAALAALAAAADYGTSMATASSPPPCPAGMTCTGSTTITDTTVDPRTLKPSMGAAFMTQDSLGNPMGWIDGFQLGSSNPLCAVAVRTATTAYLAREACLGGPPFDATGGHPVLALWDGSRWQVLSPGDVALLNAMRAAGITPRGLRMLGRWLARRGFR